MKQSMTDLINTVKEAEGYREQCLAILEYLETNDVVRKEKVETTESARNLSTMAGCILGAYYWRWHFLLNNPSAKDCYDSEVRGSECLKNMCCNILQAFKEGKIASSTETANAFALEFIALLDAIFPEGQNDNLNVYLNQHVDFGVLDFDADKGRPSLYQIKEYRRLLFTELIKTLICKNHLSIAINVFKQYSNKYNLRFRSLFVSISSLNALDDLGEFDLSYLLAGIDSEQANLVYREASYLKTVKRLCDSGYQLRAPTTHINDELINEISDLKNNLLYEGLNEEQRYYLSILVREYFEIADSKGPEGHVVYGKFLNVLRQAVEERLTVREKEYEEKLLADFNKGDSNFGDTETKNLFIEFLKTCEMCKSYKGYKNFGYDKINYTTLFNKVKANNAIVKRIAAAQYRFSKIKELDSLGYGDFTNLIAVQVKVIERYLKEIIVQNMVNEAITYDNKRFVIYAGYTAENLSGEVSSEHPQDSFSIELAAAAHIVRNPEKGWWRKCGDAPNNSFFYSKAPDDFGEWRRKVRNGYFHIHPVNTLEEAKEIHYKTAYCLMRCIQLLKQLKR